ncbi:MAG: hypothetical protein Q9221_007522 [Calogaya cf. arnoldii]
MLFHQNINVVTDTCLGSGVETHNERTESTYAEGFNPTLHNYRSHRHHPAIWRPSNTPQQPGIVHRHTRIIIDRFETYFNVPRNERPPVKPFKGYPMHPHYGGPQFVSTPGSQAPVVQPASPISEAANALAVSLQLPGRRSAPTAAPTELSGTPRYDLFQPQREEDGFGNQATKFPNQKPHPFAPPSGMEASCSGNPFPEDSPRPLDIQITQNLLAHPPVESLQHSGQPSPMVVSTAAPQFPRPRFQHHHNSIAQPTIKSGQQPDTQNQAESTGSATTKRPHAALAADRQPSWVNKYPDKAAKDRAKKNNPCKLRKKARRQAEREEAEQTAANETNTADEMPPPDEKMPLEEIAGLSDMATAHGQADEGVEIEPDNIKLEYSDHGGIYSFLGEKVDIGEWLE